MPPPSSTTLKRKNFTSSMYMSTSDTEKRSKSLAGSRGPGTIMRSSFLHSAVPHASASYSSAVMRSSFMSGPATYQWSRKTEVISWSFVRTTATYTKEAFDFNFEKKAIEESISIAANWEIDWKSGKKDGGFIGEGFSKRGIYVSPTTFSILTMPAPILTIFEIYRAGLETRNTFSPSLSTL